MTEIIIGIDIGTGSTKVVAFDVKKTMILESASQYYPTDFQGDRHEQDPLLIYDAFKKAYSALTAKLPVHQVISIAFSSALHSLIAVDKDGKPLTKCIIWSDSRSKKEAIAIKKSSYAHEIYEKTGTPIHPMSPLCKITHIRDTMPRVFANTYKFISIKAYILSRLGHDYLTDHSLASATGLFDIKTLQWHAPALEVAGISPRHLARPVPTTHQLKAKSNSETRSLGINQGTPIIIGGGDGPLANLGARSLYPNQGCLTLGTSGAFRITSTKILKDPSERIFNYIIDHQLYASGGAVNSGGIILKWLQDLFSYKENNTGNFRKLFEEVSSISPGSEGLIFLPWILGERAPIWDTEVRGMYYGVSLHHNQRHFNRAAMEGVCFNLLNIAKIIQNLSGKIDRINFNGGLAQSTFFSQTLADIFGVEINVNPEVDLSAYGAVVLALKTLGCIRNFEEVPLPNHKPLTFFPNPDHTEIYQASFVRFMDLLEFNSSNNIR